MKCLLLCLFVAGLSQAAIAQNKDILITRNASLSIYSSAPIEDIKAKSDQAVSAINTKTGDIFFKVLISTFQFHNNLMQEHFNEDYLQSDKYPFAQFSGKIQNMQDYSKDGNFPVTVKGQLTIHNVSRAYTVQGTLVIKGSQVTASSVFKVRLADHHIAIPRLVIENIAEVVQVTVSATYSTASPQGGS